MTGLRASAPHHRFGLIALLILALAARLVLPAGYMPDWSRGHLTIGICGSDSVAPAVAAAFEHRGVHGQEGKQDPAKPAPPCPYGTVASAGALGADAPALDVALAMAVALLLGRVFRSVGRYRPFERPPLRGPPFSILH